MLKSTRPVSHPTIHDASRVCRWLLEGLWHGIVCFFVPLLALGQSRRNGTVDGVFSYGVATYTALIIITNLKVTPSPCLLQYRINASGWQRCNGHDELAGSIKLKMASTVSSTSAFCCISLPQLLMIFTSGTQFCCADSGVQVTIRTRI